MARADVEDLDPDGSSAKAAGSAAVSSPPSRTTISVAQATLTQTVAVISTVLTSGDVEEAEDDAFEGSPHAVKICKSTRHSSSSGKQRSLSSSASSPQLLATSTEQEVSSSPPPPPSCPSSTPPTTAAKPGASPSASVASSASSSTSSGRKIPSGSETSKDKWNSANSASPSSPTSPCSPDNAPEALFSTPALSDTDAHISEGGFSQSPPGRPPRVRNQSGSNLARTPSASRSDLNESESGVGGSGGSGGGKRNKSSSKTSLSKEKKKSSAWYNALYPTYKSRSEDFKKILAGLGLSSEERLVVEYSCALQRDILVHGRLYITRNLICFYANILRWETSLVVRWSDVISISKEKTALVIPNAIQIGTEKEKHFFTSFAARDKTYLMLYKLWQSSNMQQSGSPADLWQLIHDAYGEELGLTSDDDADYVSPFLANTTFTSCVTFNSVTLSTSKSASDALGSRPTKDTLFSRKIGSARFAKENSRLCDVNGDLLSPDAQLSTTSADNGIEFKAKADHHGKVSKPRLMTSSPTTAGALAVSGSTAVAPSGVGRRAKSAGCMPVVDLSEGTSAEEDNLDEEDDDEEEEDGILGQEELEDVVRKRHRRMGRGGPVAARLAEQTLDSWRSAREGKEMTSEVYSVDVDTLFTLLFTNSKFYVDFHGDRKTFDIVKSEWECKAQSNDKFRQVSFTLSLTHPMGPKHSQVTEVQVMKGEETYPGETYVIDVDTFNAGIPYADSFYVTSHFCLTRVSAKSSRMTVISAIKYRKTVWGIVKNFIEKNTWSGLDDFYTHLSRALQLACDEVCYSREQGTTRGHAPRRPKPPSALLGRDATGRPNDKETQAAHKPSISSIDTRPSFSWPIFGSFASAITASDVLFRLILVLLIALLTANSLLFYKMWFLETKLVDDVVRSSSVDSSKEIWSHVRMLMRDSGSQTTPSSTDEWVALLHRQEVAHQKELEKWHRMLGAATDLLRRTEQSLSNLQRGIHPLTLQKLRGLLYLDDVEVGHHDDSQEATIYQTPKAERSPTP